MSVDKISNGSQTNPTTINGSLHLNGANDKLSTTNTKETNIESASKELTHWTIKDGWFSEENEEWPGQALRLRVKKILHVSQSKYQDVSFWFSLSSNYHYMPDTNSLCLLDPRF